LGWAGYGGLPCGGLPQQIQKTVFSAPQHNRLGQKLWLTTDVAVARSFTFCLP
jgi:hypothetical protein